MKFNTANKEEKKEAFRYFTILSNKRQVVEIKKISPGRSLNQNSYLHLLLGDFGQHFGYDLEEAKTVYKRDINPELYVYEKNNSKFLKSSADLSKDDFAISIDKLMRVSAELGYPLPPATDMEWVRRAENDIEKARRYM